MKKSLTLTVLQHYTELVLLASHLQYMIDDVLEGLYEWHRLLAVTLLQGPCKQNSGCVLSPEEEGNCPCLMVS